MDDLACTKCMWTGRREDGRYYIYECPMCGSQVEYIDNYEYLPYQDSFNWSKK